MLTLSRVLVSGAVRAPAAAAAGSQCAATTITRFNSTAAQQVNREHDVCVSVKPQVKKAKKDVISRNK